MIFNFISMASIKTGFSWLHFSWISLFKQKRKLTSRDHIKLIIIVKSPYINFVYITHCFAYFTPYSEATLGIRDSISGYERTNGSFGVERVLEKK